MNTQSTASGDLTSVSRQRSQRAELLMPAGSLEKLKMALTYGADAVYIGTPDMSLRTKSAFTLAEVVEGIEFAHTQGKRVYLTLNLFSHNKDLEKLPTLVETVRKVQPDGVIVADPGIFQYLKEHAPELPIHISTQANVCSSLSVDFWHKQGAELCVLAREVSFQELSEIRADCPDILLEAFVHGSMCMTYSGRCLLSNFMSERGANQGNCAHSCRWNYKMHVRLKDGTLKEIEFNDDNKDLFEFLLEEQCRPGELMTIEEDERGSYIMNSKDLCLMPKLADYLKLGVNSLKVEGRNKSQYYIAIVARAYRMAIDDWYDDPENWSPDRYMEELHTIPNRGYTMAFHDGRLSNHGHNFDNEKSLSEWEFAGIITETNEEGLTVHVRNRISKGDVVEFVSPISKAIILMRLYEFKNPFTKENRDQVHGGQDYYFTIPYTAFDREELDEIKRVLIPYTVLRKERELTEQFRQRVSLDIISQGVELGQRSDSEYRSARDSLRETLKSEPLPSRFKSARVGTDGCCGKGCNGCLIFSHDPAYAKAREIFKNKRIGEKLETDMREDITCTTDLSNKDNDVLAEAAAIPAMPNSTDSSTAAL